MNNAVLDVFNRDHVLGEIHPLRLSLGGRMGVFFRLLDLNTQ